MAVLFISTAQIYMFIAVVAGEEISGKKRHPCITASPSAFLAMTFIEFFRDLLCGIASQTGSQAQIYTNNNIQFVA